MVPRNSEDKMVGLFLHNRRLESVFELLGVKENSITYSLGWALSHSPGFLHNVLASLFGDTADTSAEIVRLQEYEKKKGYTDVEIIGSHVHVIIEAKRGWWLPGADQLNVYAGRLEGSKRQYRALVVVAECSSEYAQLHLPRAINGVSVAFVSWKQIHNLSNIAVGSHAEKRLLAQFRTYLGRIVKMQNQESNLVYVVSLGRGIPDGSTISWMDVVKKKGRYFHPVGGGWPKDPPNYLAFRYDGKLQTIHHVESWQIVDDIHAAIPEIKAVDWPPHYLYTLGNAIIPPKDVRTGKIYPSGRVWAMLDLLLTCGTISEARDLTKKRLSGEN